MGSHARSSVAPLVVIALAVGAGCRRTERTEPVRGDALFAASCARCHGQDGRGGTPSAQGPTPRNFRDHAFHAARSDADLKRTIREGKGTGMPAFGAGFDEAQLAALLAHLRTFDPGPGGPVGSGVPAERASQGPRGKGNEAR